MTSLGWGKEVIVTFVKLCMYVTVEPDYQVAVETLAKTFVITMSLKVL